MNNRTLWQLTADGVSELRVAPNGHQQIESYEDPGTTSCGGANNDVSLRIGQTVNYQVERAITEHSFELSSRTVAPSTGSKVYTVK
ncbi:hypothetical protein Pcaca04_10850 [Pectobacterium carotovorum subsp. carotovorum]|nr:hypothetical protein Pcaca04_10850 [Pectobacterium carotovorum subsp. carotovorum]